MADNTTPTSPSAKPTLGLTGLTSNAMALIAPGAFLWLTYEEQAAYGAPMAGQAMWFGIIAALLLCLATAVSYAELSKLYPGAGSSYFYAEQAFLSKPHAFKYARIMKFMTGWASHLYYWVYPGLMVGVTALLIGYLAGILFPNTFSSTYSSPLLMALFCVVFAIGVSYIAYRGVGGTTGVNLAINIIQIGALLVFSAIALGYRLNHPQDSQGWHLSNGNVINYNVDSVNAPGPDGKDQPDSWADGTPKYQTEKDITADDLDPAKNKDAEALAAMTTDMKLGINDPLPDFQKDKDGKYIKDKDGKLQIVVAMKTTDRAVTADDLDKTKNKDGEGADRLAALTAMGLGVGDPYPTFTKDKDGKYIKTAGVMVPDPFTVSYKASDAISGYDGNAKQPLTFNFHTTAASVVSPHGFNLVFIQACIAILILVGFESVSAMGEEAKNPKRDIPRAILLALVIQGAFCYAIEYFCASYMLHNGYTLGNAAGSSAPIGDLMQIAGAWAFGSAKAGRAFMLVQAFTVFLALIGTTLSCLSTGARVTYAMGRDEELGAHFGLLHEKNLSPHKAIWALCGLSIIIGIITVTIYLGGTSPAPLDPMYKNIWYSIGIFSPTAYTWLPNTFVMVTLISNFGTFMLYMITCIVAIVAFREHHMFNGIKHMVIPVFGVVANATCMLFYLIAPFSVAGMSWHEPYIALGVCAAFGIWGLIYFSSKSKAKNKEIFLTQKPVATL